MDLNQLYFDRQVSLIKAQEAGTPSLRGDHESEVARLDGRIRHLQGRLGAHAAGAFTARPGGQPA